MAPHNFPQQMFPTRLADIRSLVSLIRAIEQSLIVLNQDLALWQQNNQRLEKFTDDDAKPNVLVVVHDAGDKVLSMGTTRVYQTLRTLFDQLDKKGQEFCEQTRERKLPRPCPLYRLSLDPLADIISTATWTAAMNYIDYIGDECALSCPALPLTPMPCPALSL
jgi:hypothetical protein